MWLKVISCLQHLVYTRALSHDYVIKASLGKERERERER